MPIAHYIIGCQLQSEDVLSGLASFFNVTGALDVTAWGQDVPARYKAALEAGGGIWVSASWMRTNDDEPEQEYEGQWLTHAPNRPEPRILPIHNFVIRKRTYRHTIKFIIAKHTGASSGLHTVENRIRRAGSDDPWTSQFFPIWVNYTEPPR